MYLISKANATAEQDTADDKHGEVLSGGVEDNADDEEETCYEHGESPAEFSSGV